MFHGRGCTLAGGSEMCLSNDEYVFELSVYAGKTYFNTSSPRPKPPAAVAFATQAWRRSAISIPSSTACLRGRASTARPDRDASSAAGCCALATRAATSAVKPTRTGGFARTRNIQGKRLRRGETLSKLCLYGAMDHAALFATGNRFTSHSF